jgi:hypothetical protein
MEAARIAPFAETKESASALACLRIDGAMDQQAVCEQLPARNLKESQNMKKLAGLTMPLAALLALAPFALAQQKTQPESQGQDKLVEIVRNATQQYQDVSKATGYTPLLGCVSGSDHGAMGVHYVNTDLIDGNTLLSNGQLDPTRPQALIYEPLSNGEMKLVGVEFIILASALPPDAAPQVEGHLMVYVDGPSTSRPKAPANRYGLPAFFELHVWAWRDNPQGSFVDWNDHVSCAAE